MAPGGYTVAKSTIDHIVVQDDDPAIVYTPENAWYKFGGDGGNYTVTNAYLAQFTYTFTGSEVWYYSDVNGDHGNFSVALDGVSQGIKTSTAPSWRPQIVLFHATLEPGKHTLTVMSVNEHNNVTSLDYLAYRPLTIATPSSSTGSQSRESETTTVQQSDASATDSSGSVTTLPAIPPAAPSPSHSVVSNSHSDAAPSIPSDLTRTSEAESEPPAARRPAVAVYVGIALGVTAFFLSLSIAILVLFLRRGKRRRAKSPVAHSAWSQGIRPFPITRPAQAHRPAPSEHLPEYSKVDRLR